MILALLLSMSFPDNAHRVVEAFLQAVRDDPIDAVVQSLHPGFVFRDPQGTFSINRDGYEDILAFDRAVDLQFSAELVPADDGRIHCTLMETNRFLTLLGIAGQRVKLQLVVEEGRLKEMILEEVTTDGPSYQDALAPVLEWAQRRSHPLLEQVLADGRPLWTGGSAAAWLQLLEDWRREEPGRPARQP